MGLDEHDALTVSVSDDLVNKLVAERAKYKATRQYDKADAVRAGLEAKFGVIVDDRLREWSVGGDFGEEHNRKREMSLAMAHRPYVRSAGDEQYSDDTQNALSTNDEAHVQAQVDKRANLKGERKFDEADAIRDGLQRDFGVIVHDKLRCWSVGGNFGNFNVDGDGNGYGVDGNNPSFTGGRQGYVRRGGGDLEAAAVEEIERLLRDRMTAKKNRDFSAADGIRDHIRDKYQVKVDDRSKEWRLDTNEYGRVENDENLSSIDQHLSPEDLDHVQVQLAKRFKAKIVGDYAEADEIRDGLREKFGIVVDDRTKEWKVVEATKSDDDHDFASSVERVDVDVDIDADKDIAFDDPLADDDGPVASYDDETNGNEDDKNNDAEASLYKLTVVQLKERLKDAGLKVSGTKAVLVERLLEGTAGAQ